MRRECYPKLYKIAMHEKVKNQSIVLTGALALVDRELRRYNRAPTKSVGIVVPAIYRSWAYLQE
ncbi:hypothetical protein BTJ40_05425 [Microbulbifer sp. A4B17]|nr:hypothetical protein BTJ40_05425 [Microbulbifer sp. A4B17]